MTQAIMLCLFLLVALLAGCGLLGETLGTVGAAPYASTPVAQEKAAVANQATADYLHYILFGTTLLAGAAGHSRGKKAGKKLAATVPRPA